MLLFQVNHCSLFSNGKTYRFFRDDNVNLYRPTEIRQKSEQIFCYCGNFMNVVEINTAAKRKRQKNNVSMCHRNNTKMLLNVFCFAFTLLTAISVHIRAV